MSTAVITGGSHGIGAALASRLVREGHRVLVVGRSGDGPEGSEPIPGDLSTVEGVRAVGEQITDRIDRLDWLVLGAGRFQRRRVLTSDGFEHTFALMALGRHLLTDRLVPLLETRERPVVVNLCGVAGLGGPGVQWHDLTLSTYSSSRAVSQAARTNDLLGAGFHDRYAGSPVRYVLHNPLFVDSGLGAQVGGVAGRLLDLVAKVAAQPVDRAAALVHPFLVDPPAAPLTASRKGKPVDLTRREFDRDAATRLYALLDRLVADASA